MGEITQEKHEIEKKEKHDGYLDESHTIKVRQRDDFNDVFMYGPYGRNMWLEPSEALSLLNWLTQEKATLERLAKEAE